MEAVVFIYHEERHLRLNSGRPRRPPLSTSHLGSSQLRDGANVPLDQARCGGHGQPISTVLRKMRHGKIADVACSGALALLWLGFVFMA